MQARTSGGDFLFGIRVQHHERIFDAPVGCIGDMRNARQAVELDVVAAGDAGQRAQHASCAAAACARSRRRTARPPACASSQQALDRPRCSGGVPRSHAGGGAAQSTSAPRACGIVKQVVLQVGIALHHPDVAQHFVQHARGTSGAALVAQPLTMSHASSPRMRIRSRGRRTRCSCRGFRVIGRSWRMQVKPRCAFYRNAQRRSTCMEQGY